MFFHNGNRFLWNSLCCFTITFKYLSDNCSEKNYFGGNMNYNQKINVSLRDHILNELSKQLKTALTKDQQKTIVSVLNKALQKKHIINAGSVIPFIKKYYLVFMFGKNQRLQGRYITLDRRYSASLKKYFYFFLIMSSGIIICSYVSLLWILNFLV